MAKLEFSSYLPSALSEMSEKTLRKEYSRLRDIARKRLQRLEASEFSQSTAYKLNKDRYIKLSEVKSKKDLISRLSDLSRFIEARSSSVTGQRGIIRDRLETLSESGYTFVNKNNLKEFGEFMKFMKSLFPKHPSASPGEASRLFSGYRELRQSKVSPAEMQDMFTSWMAQNTPDTYYLRPSFTPIPDSFRIKDPWSS